MSVSTSRSANPTSDEFLSEGDAAERRDAVLAVLRNRFAAIGLDTLAVDRLALFRQDDAASRFRIIGHWPLRAELPAENYSEQR